MGVGHRQKCGVKENTNENVSIKEKLFKFYLVLLSGLTENIIILLMILLFSYYVHISCWTFLWFSYYNNFNKRNCLYFYLLLLSRSHCIDYSWPLSSLPTKIIILASFGRLKQCNCYIYCKIPYPSCLFQTCSIFTVETPSHKFC